MNNGTSVRAIMAGIVVLVSLHCFGCSIDAGELPSGPQGVNTGQPVRYAKRFSITGAGDGCTLVRVLSPGEKETGMEYAYLLVPGHREIPEDCGEARVVRTPVKSVSCETGFQVELLDMLGCFGALRAVSGKMRVGQDKVHRLIDSGDLPVTGFMRGLNMETMLEVDPDLAFVNVTSVSTDLFEKMIGYGLRPGFFCASLEEHPLGALEWIKFVGAFFGKDSLAAEIFRQREKAYLDVVKEAGNFRHRPKVIAGYSRKGAWSTMGSSRWFATMLEHAGADYLFRGQRLDRGHVLSHEVAMAAGMEADFWVNTHFGVTDLDGLIREDRRYDLFRSVRNGTVYNNNNCRFGNGRNRFWDTGMTEPHVVLGDLVSIFHPGFLPERNLKYYRRLQGVGQVPGVGQ